MSPAKRNAAGPALDLDTLRLIRLMYALNVSANVQWTIVSLHAVSYVRVVCPCVLCMQLHSLTSEPCFTLKKNMAGSLGQHSHFLLDLGVSINQICKKKIHFHIYMVKVGLS